MGSTYRISQLARLSRIPATTLRFYETVGLLPAARTASGYRVYGEEAVERLAFISSAKLLGLPLEEIRELLEVWGHGVCAEVRQRMLPVVENRIADAEGRIAELSALVARLASVHTELSGPAPPGGCRPDCGCVTTAGPPVPTPLSRARPEAPDRWWRQVPVACTLVGVEQGERVRQWHRVLSAATAREQIDDGLRVTFPADPKLAAEIARLAAAEQDCCGFFDFTLHLTPGALELSVRAPETADALLVELFGATARSDLGLNGHVFAWSRTTHDEKEGDDGIAPG